MTTKNNSRKYDLSLVLVLVLVLLIGNDRQRRDFIRINLSILWLMHGNMVFEEEDDTEGNIKLTLLVGREGRKPELTILSQCFFLFVCSVKHHI